MKNTETPHAEFNNDSIVVKVKTIFLVNESVVDC